MTTIWYTKRYKFIRKNAPKGTAFLFLFLISIFINNCKLYSKDTDSLSLFDLAVSYQSMLSTQEQIAITKKAENYALSKGNVYKALSYACLRGKLYFLSDNNDSCEQLYHWLIPAVENELKHNDESRFSSVERREYADPDDAETRKKSEESLSWKILLVDSYSNKALNMMFHEQSDSSLQIYQELLQRFAKDSVPLILAKCFNGMGVVFANSKLFDRAGTYLLKALQQFDLANDSRGVFGVCSNIVAFYNNQGLYEEALPYGLRSYRIAQDEKYNGQEQIYASLIMGTIYSGLTQYDMADSYFEKAFLLAQKKNLAHLEGFCGQEYSQNLLNMREYAKARETAEHTMKIIAGKKKYALQANLLMILSEVAERQDDTKAALLYYRQYMQMKDSLNELDNMRQLIYADIRHTQDQREEENRIKETAFKKISEQSQRRGMWIAALSVLAALLLAGGSLATWLLLKSRKGIRNLRLETSRQVAEAERQVISKNKELATHTLQQLRLNNLQESILKELKTLKTSFTLRGKEKAIVCNLEDLARQIASDKEWKDFQFYFEQVDSDFMNKLTERYPDLNANEKHLCVLFKLGLTNRDVANLTGKSIQSVGMAKFRLKSKFGIENSEEISKFLREL